MAGKADRALKVLKALHDHWDFEREGYWYTEKSAGEQHFRYGWESILHELGHYLDLTNCAPSVGEPRNFEDEVSNLIHNHEDLGSDLTDANEMMAVAIELEMVKALKLSIDADRLMTSVAKTNLCTVWSAVALHREVRRLRKSYRVKVLVERGLDFLEQAAETLGVA